MKMTGMRGIVNMYCCLIVRPVHSLMRVSVPLDS